MKYILTATVVLVGLSACSPNSATNQDFNREAGSSLDDGTFGAATMNNTLIHTGQANLTINLAKRFAAEVNSTITFPFNSTALDETARATLRQQATWINQFPEVRFKVFGHTDLVGSQAYNRKLGLARAEAALLYLTSQGIDRSRLEAVVSFGETQPLIVTNGQERQNRRTVTEVSGFVNGGNSSLLNGKYAEIIYREYTGGARAASSVTEATATPE
ncbi:MAG: OmpA family protein [Loktanella sp.]|nr:OmpA family protein [bacterium]MDO7609049.1 OmpA family protein [Loktanella sp.]